MQTILVCDDNEVWLDALSLTIDKEPQFKVVAQAIDGRMAIEQIGKFRPNILILDIVLPEYDGIYIVNYIRKNMEGYSPIIYMLSGLGTDSAVKQLNELGIDYYSMKPISMDMVIDTLMTLVKHRRVLAALAHEPGGENKIAVENDLIEPQVRDLLRRLGIMPHLISFKCVFDAIMMYPRNSEQHVLLSKDLYPQVAKKHNTTSSAVEKNIRYAISQMQKLHTQTYSNLFFYSKAGHITNGEFLSVLSDYIGRMEKRPLVEENQFE